jgi:hypothetical protein
MLPWQTPAILLAFLTWLQSPPATFAEAARREALRRQVVPKAVRSLSNADVERVPRDMPRSPPSEAAPAPTASAAPAEQPVTTPEAHDENWWRARAVHARDALDRDRLLAEALQSRVNAMTTDWSAHDDPAQRQMLWDQRQRAIDELANITQQLAVDQTAIEVMEEEARREGVPAGWLR